MDEDDRIKSVPRPDENELKEKIERINLQIASLQSRLASIKESLDSRDSGRGDPAEVQLAKGRLNESKSEVRRLSQERRNIYDQINAADALKKQQQARPLSFAPSVPSAACLCCALYVRAHYLFVCVHSIARRYAPLPLRSDVSPFCELFYLDPSSWNSAGTGSAPESSAQLFLIRGN